MSKSNFLETGILNHVFRTATLAKLTNVHVSLHTADPTDAGTGAEVTGGAYARVAVGVADANWNAPGDDGAGNQQISNVNAITFPAPTANWGTVTHLGIWDAATAGNLLYRGALTTSRTINNGDGAPSFAAGTLVVKEG